MADPDEFRVRWAFRLECGKRLCRRDFKHYLEWGVLIALLITSLFLSTLAVLYFIDASAEVKAIHDPVVRITTGKDVLLAAGQILGGAFILAGLYYTARNLFQTREGQLTDRFSKAIDLLGDPTSEAKRIGGVHALARIANDSDTDYWAIMEILSAYVRSKSLTMSIEEVEKNGSLTSVELQVAMTAIATRRFCYRGGEAQPLNLRRSNLSGRLDLRGANLIGADLREANLEYADLRNAKLLKALLGGANLTGARLERANLSDADLNGAVLVNTNLYKAQLKGAKLRLAVIEGTIFVKASLQECSLKETTLRKVSFTNARLDNADLEGARFEECWFHKTTLKNAVVEKAVFHHPKQLTEEQLRKTKGSYGYVPVEPPNS